MTFESGIEEEPGIDIERGVHLATAAVGGTPRPGQLVMSQAVADALQGRGHLLVQAGTGTGKSLAYLVPAFAHAITGRPVVVATATVALQRQLIERDIPAITSALAEISSRPLAAAVLKGRHHYLCRLRLDGASSDPKGSRDEDDALWSVGGPGAGRLTLQAQSVRGWADETTTGDRDDLPEPVDSAVWRAVSVTSAECVGRSRCPFGQECFAERARDAAREADVVVTNHAMLAVEIVEGVPVLPEHDGIIIDEGHEWIDRATQAATVSLSGADVESLAASIRRGSPKEASDLASAAKEWDAAIAALHSADAPSDPVRVEQVPPVLHDAATTVRAAARAAQGALSPLDPDAAPAAVSGRQRVRAGLDTVVSVSDRILGDSANQVIWIVGRPGSVHLAPLSISDVMGARMTSTSLVVTSATLGDPSHAQPFDGLARALGIEDMSWRGLDVGSPFDYSRQGILYVAAHLPEPGRSPVDETVLDEMAELIEAAGGRTLALFSSWRAVERAGEYLPVRLGVGIPILVQRRGEPVGSLVESFRTIEDSVLIGTVSLWQGVDVPGDACRLVVIDRIPFARPDDPVLAARAKRIDDAGGSGFAEVALPRAATLLAQGVGRLIRGVDDRGVVAICDPRLVTKGYGSRLVRALPPLWFTTDPRHARDALRRLGEDAQRPPRAGEARSRLDRG